MNTALVLLSGGMKSAIVLHMAKRYNPHVEAILFDCHYTPQRKRDCAIVLAEQAGVKLHAGTTPFAKLDNMPVWQPQELTRPHHWPSWDRLFPRSERHHQERGLLLAEELGCRELYAGTQHALSSTTCKPSGGVVIVRPLLGMDGHKVIEMAKELDRGGEADMSQVLRETWSCERPRPPVESSSPCALCRGCLVRALAFTAAGLPDPLICESQINGQFPKEWLNSGLHPAAFQMLKEEQAGISD